ncbi:hypothetical protein AOQ84DRAFT_438920 [Glonium stellatum]|uniref:Uncharacterized protein n=1 Tax=Glonium stellatum TaxID=574774 RepID=A0A8E2F3B6_9PEZI|nr:hypothetical protein AOQ84DRAFT_438920 [Glonium stellatum]
MKQSASPQYRDRAQITQRHQSSDPLPEAMASMSISSAPSTHTSATITSVAELPYDYGAFRQAESPTQQGQRRKTTNNALCFQAPHTKPLDQLDSNQGTPQSQYRAPISHSAVEVASIQPPMGSIANSQNQTQPNHAYQPEYQQGTPLSYTVPIQSNQPQTQNSPYPQNMQLSCQPTSYSPRPATQPQAQQYQQQTPNYPSAPQQYQRQYVNYSSTQSTTVPVSAQVNQTPRSYSNQMSQHPQVQPLYQPTQTNQPQRSQASLGHATPNQAFTPHQTLCAQGPSLTPTASVLTTAPPQYPQAQPLQSHNYPTQNQGYSPYQSPIPQTTSSVISVPSSAAYQSLPSSSIPSSVTYQQNLLTPMASGTQASRDGSAQPHGTTSSVQVPPAQIAIQQQVTHGIATGHYTNSQALQYNTQQSNLIQQRGQYVSSTLQPQYSTGTNLVQYVQGSQQLSYVANHQEAQQPLNNYAARMGGQEPGLAPSPMQTNQANPNTAHALQNTQTGKKDIGSSLSNFWDKQSTGKKVALGVGGALVAGFLGYEAVEAVGGIGPHHHHRNHHHRHKINIPNNNINSNNTANAAVYNNAASWDQTAFNLACTDAAIF